MTVVLCIRCDDGMVMAADSQITDRARGMSYPGRKLHPLGSYGAWGGSGARSVLLDVEKRFAESADLIHAADDVGRALQQHVQPVLKYHYDHYIEQVPGEQNGGGPAAYVLAAGYSGDEPWIVEVNPHAMVSHYEGIGFHAIGSGAPLAHQAGTLLAHFRMTERALKYGVVAAVRVIDALSRTSPSVGGVFDVCRITPEGVEHLDEDEMTKVFVHVRRWTDLEQKVIDNLF